MIKGLTIVLGLAIAILLIVGAVNLYDHYDKQKDLEKKQAAAENINPRTLPGMPEGWEEVYEKAERGGAAGLRSWLRTYGPRVQDPRRAWIELDYMVMISNDDPSEAKRIFADVKGRTPEDSPIYPRIKKLAKTYE